MFLLKNILAIRRFSSYTIFSKSSGSGKCGIAVIRVSGDKTRQALKKMTGSDSFKPRYASLRPIRDPTTSTLIDNGLILFFESPRSFTGEDSGEFHVHGGNATVSAMLSALSKIEGLRPAEPGEFTKRAFFNGKMDLAQVEGLADLIHSETEFQRRQALIQADGHLSKVFRKWRKQLIRSIAHVEAYIDFSEDENIEDGVLETVAIELRDLEVELQQHLEDARMGERLRDGVKLVILGDTNVGKSSLMNLLVQRDISIVTDVAGTTRDVIESHFDINGYPVVIADTAGLRDSNDKVETEGILRAKKYATNADLVILVIDGKKFELSNTNFQEYFENYLRTLGIDKEVLNDKKILTIVNKIDLVSEKFQKQLENEKISTISCINGTNIKEILIILTESLKELCGDPNCESPVLSHARHSFFVHECLDHLRRFLKSFDCNSEQDLAILVQNLRNSVRSIGRITGEVRTDDVLDVIFRDFCIGK